MKKFIRDNLKKIILFALVLIAIGVFLGITVKKQNDMNKNAVVFVFDDLYYNNVYRSDRKNINKILKKHYARPVVITYSLYRFSYDELEQKIRTGVENSCPTHIIFSPITALNLYKSNATSEIGTHNRGRARLVSLSKIGRTELFDVSYKESSEDLYNLFSSIINAQDENTAFVFNNYSGKENSMSLEEIRTKIDRDVFYLDEGMREKGENETKELYASLAEKDTKIIVSLGFKNLQNLSNLFESEKQNILFILPETLKNDVKPNQLGASIGIDFPLLLDQILDEVEITEKTTLGDNKAPLKINIKNKSIKPIIEKIAEEIRK